MWPQAIQVLPLSHLVPLSDTKVKVQQVKGMFLYSAVSSSLDCSKRFTLHPLALWQTSSFRYQLDFSEKYSSHAVIRREDYSLTFSSLCLARYSFIQLSELGHHRENKNAQTSKRYQKGYSNPGTLVCELGILPLNYRAPTVMTQI